MVSTLNANRNVQDFQNVYVEGKKDERRVKAFLCSLGYTVTNSSKNEDMFEDIDGWVGGVSVSIKAEHSALKYTNRCFYFELSQKLTGVDTWEESWFYQGKAEKYLILQGTELFMIDREKLHEYILENGFDYERTLGWRAKQRSGGTYRYDDAKCGFISIKKVPIERTWNLADTVAA